MPTDWEDHYRRADTPWNKGAPSPALLEYLMRSPVRGDVLVPGCGAGYDVRALAATADEVVGVDIAPSAVSMARKFPSVGGEQYVEADFFSLPRKLRGRFDYVFEHTCFCAIDLVRRVDYAEAAASALRQDGKLLGIFYLDTGQDLRSDGPPYETTLAELDRLFSPRFKLLEEWAPTRTYAGREKREWMRLWRLREAP